MQINDYGCYIFEVITSQQDPWQSADSLTSIDHIMNILREKSILAKILVKNIGNKLILANYYSSTLNL